MSGWHVIEGRAVALAQENIDTDQLIPARFMSAPRSTGYGGFLLHDARQDDTGHVLNRFAGTSVLVTRRNFGSGSSREAAVYALVDFGVRAVFAPSFGDIFAGNAVNNGLLPARLPAEEIEALIEALGSNDALARVDLNARQAVIGGHAVVFDLDPLWQQKLVNGWDDIDLTTQHQAQILQFRAARFAAHQWAAPTV
ncbi:3-isopropylmalate/(R)-2-methylmalate dehydratase small subunit [Pseudorhodobacter antarcticus]|jgi:3-isopropylmalate/(R)-2-methylmalate dehydratase small subunit|uniref:3-isopropylmalate dehydratase n=1 Tax=Pseudorhodobacter antarcticus TaxID=1077947 RepID=A0A1H8GXN0_9RHOB|nr:3-isopropylmalate dehydratase small subunit [Pseudorhodobacter antarcticus]SEN48832.1 3-isopropylmalate/(R)-2-methylmalate dehydratase small subunit [Pseudorhodobacter antarcticus]